MKDYHFISETSNKQKIKIFLIAVFSLFIIISMFVVFSLTIKEDLNNPFNNIFQQIKKEMFEFSSIGLFYSGFFGGLFFLPIPQELFYYFGLIKGNHIVISFLFLNAGYLLAQWVNYQIGKRLNKPIMDFVSKRRVYKARRLSKKYGSLGVFIFNFLPLPAPILSFALGITRY